MSRATVLVAFWLRRADELELELEREAAAVPADVEGYLKKALLYERAMTLRQCAAEVTKGEIVTGP